MSIFAKVPHEFLLPCLAETPPPSTNEVTTVANAFPLVLFFKYTIHVFRGAYDVSARRDRTYGNFMSMKIQTYSVLGLSLYSVHTPQKTPVFSMRYEINLYIKYTHVSNVINLENVMGKQQMRSFCIDGSHSNNAFCDDKTHFGLQCKVGGDIFCQILTKFISSTDFHKRSKSQISRNSSSGNRADICGHTGTTKQRGSFRKYANAHRNESHFHGKYALSSHFAVSRYNHAKCSEDTTLTLRTHFPLYFCYVSGTGRTRSDFRLDTITTSLSLRCCQVI